ncbi:hypothetical protein EBB07_29680 [Paenibacillaceae bacterium]|nr:hypothetical protein EBB07_29680 [Paenibacillaceae bacterium]
MDFIYAVCVGVLFIVAMYFIDKYLNAKDINKEKFKKVIEIARLLVGVFKLKQDTRDRSLLILDIADSAVNKVFLTVETDNIQDKISISLEAINETLSQLGIEPTENELRLIEIIVTESLNFLEKRQK